MSDDIILRLRELAKPGTSLGDVGGTCVFTEAANEIARLRLTDAEREAVEAAVNFCELTDKPLPRSEQIIALRKMLERLG